MISFATMTGTYPDLEPRDEETILRWLGYAIATHGDHPAYMEVKGKPVIVIYMSYALPDAVWENIFAQLRAEGLDAVFLAMFHGGLFSYGILGIISSNDEVPTTCPSSSWRVADEPIAPA
jgi:hypothetical protein